jgi:hypothetical protein
MSVAEKKRTIRVWRKGELVVTFTTYGGFRAGSVGQDVEVEVIDA